MASKVHKIKRKKAYSLFINKYALEFFFDKMLMVTVFNQNKPGHFRRKDDFRIIEALY